ncbi:MAG: HAD-IA family hydrolase [Desulfobacterota bacterium]|nr:HAD-IA family hydrolase [Thermodesulfobacteriota bacterium]
MGNNPLCIKAVLFDFDGTLTKPGALDFEAIRQAIGCPSGKPILEFIDSLSDPQTQHAARATLDRLEMEAACRSEPNDGAEEVLSFLHDRRIPVGILSRNSRAAIKTALQNFTVRRFEDFTVIIARDDTTFPKPDAEGVLMAAQCFGCKPEQVLVVGDYIYDIEAGRAAGSPTVLLTNRNVILPPTCSSDFTISHLSQLRDIIELGTPLPQGKLPHHFLKKFLADMQFSDPSVLVWPGIGEDTAAVDITNDEVIVLKSDPITFVTGNIGEYAVLVNANDIATSGALPRWFLTSLLFPPGTTPDGIRMVMRGLAHTCARWGISLCGGHTEITDAVTRPVVTGMLVGTVGRQELLEKRNIRPGDRIIMTKSAGIEGTAIIAQERSEHLLRTGLGVDEIEQCRRFLDRISILDEARIAAQTNGVIAMHDVTEGGLATAIEELSDASGRGIRVYLERIPIHPLTQRLCKILHLDPLGLIGSGCLLICCRPEAVDPLCSALKGAQIDLAIIGEVLDARTGVEALHHGTPATWPRFEVDEIARLFQGNHI